jgi:ribulose-5-phosphate 4-epimerase/fuculose-1-phosphate aldolase
VIDIIRGLDENPWEVELSPDGTRAYVATSYGVRVGNVQHSTLLVIDIDEASDSYGEVLTRLSNIGSRSEAGCE